MKTSFVFYFFFLCPIHSLIVSFQKLRREEAQEAEEKAEVDEIYEETMTAEKKKMKEKKKEIGGAENERLEKRMIEEKRKQKRTAKIAAWKKEQDKSK